MTVTINWQQLPDMNLPLSWEPAFNNQNVENGEDEIVLVIPRQV